MTGTQRPPNFQPLESEISTFRPQIPGTGILRPAKFQPLEFFGGFIIRTLIVLSFLVPATRAAETNAAAVSTNAPVAATNNAAAIESVRAVLGKWLETQQVIARERREWQQGKEILQARVEVLGREVAELDEKMKKANDSLAEAERRKSEIVATNAELKSAATKLAESAGELEGRIRTLHAKMPEPLVPRIQQLYSRIPADSANTRVSIAERFQNVLGILNEMNKFNTEIPLAYEVRNLSDGKPAEVKAFYVGLAQGYFVSPSGEAGVGVPGEKGWNWTAANDQAERIRQAIDVLQNKGSPAFIPLSMELQ